MTDVNMSKIYKLRKIFLLLFVFFILNCPYVYTMESEMSYVNGSIEKILTKKVFSEEMQMDTGLLCQFKLSVRIPSENKSVQVDYAIEKKLEKYDIYPRKGDRIILQKEINTEKNIVEYHFEGFDRTRIVIYLLIFFLVIIIIFAGLKGFNAILALIVTLALVFYVFIPMVLNGYSPIWSSVLICTLSTIATLLIIGGFGIKSYAAIVGTIGGVISAGVLAVSVGYFSRITGLYKQELLFLSNLKPDLDIRDLIISGFIIGALGATMDVAMSISSSMYEIYVADTSKSIRKLFGSGMSIGRDIIGTMINTLILAYTGSSFSILLLFVIQKKDYPLGRIINFEMIFLEIVKSLSGSIGMLVCIPMTAFIAALMLVKKRKD